MSDIKEFPVDSRDFFTKSMYLCKEFLNTNKKINIVAPTNSASQATRLAETLRRLGYVQFDDIQTQTLIRDGRRQTRIVITVHNTPDFDKLYKESLELNYKIIKEKESEQIIDKDKIKEEIKKSLESNRIVKKINIIH